MGTEGIQSDGHELVGGHQKGAVDGYEDAGDYGQSNDHRDGNLCETQRQNCRFKWIIVIIKDRGLTK